MLAPEQHQRLEMTEENKKTRNGRRLPPPLSERTFDIALNSALPGAVPLINGNTYAKMRSLFEPRVRRNDEGLELAPITRHSWEHMDTVAHGVWQMGEALRMNRKNIWKVVLATRFHDVGYDFPEGVDPRTRGKETHASHPREGAALFVNYLDFMKKFDRRCSEELQGWTAQDSELAFKAIENHSNGYHYDPELVEDTAKLPRLFDKLDNWYRRTYSSQVEKCAIGLGMSVQDAESRVRYNMQVLLDPKEEPLPQSILEEPLSKRFDDLRAFDTKFVHRLVPYAITGQRAAFTPVSGTFVTEYDVRPERISRALGAHCTADDFLNMFHEAYGTTSMGYAAEVIHSIRNRVLKLKTEVGTPTLTVRFNFSDGHMEERTYLPKMPLAKDETTNERTKEV